MPNEITPTRVLRSSSTKNNDTSTTSNKTTKHKSNSESKRKDKEQPSESDDSSVVTMQVDNSSNPSFSHVSFLMLRANVNASKKGTDTMRSVFIKLHKALKEADNTITFTQYKTDPVIDQSGRVQSNSSLNLQDTSAYPTSITALSKYYFGARPLSEGGTIWAQIRILHEEDIDNIVADTREELKEMNCHLTIQAIQHWDVARIGFLKNLHWDIDVDSLREYFQDMMKKLHRKEEITLGLKVKTPFIGQ